MKRTVQIQSVIYNNDKESLIRALNAIKTAIVTDRKYGDVIDKVVFYYGDASSQPVFSDDEVKKIQDEMEGIFELTYIFFNENTGSAKGHNILSMKCDSEYILIMNPDVILSPIFFEQIFLPFALNENVGIVEARQSPIELSKEYNHITGETEWASGACMLIPKMLFNELKGFDNDTFFMYCDDVDLSWRIRMAGYKIVYQPKAVYYHAKRLSVMGKWLPSSAEKYYSAESALLMAYKWSNHDRLQYLLNMFSNSGGIERKAVEEFKKRKAENSLPEQLDHNHKIARFEGYYFTAHRFFLI